MSDPVPVKLAIQIRWRDLDALGHVNNAVYLTYFELARLAYIRTLLGADAPIDQRTLLPVDFQFILAEVTCHYRSPATLGDQLVATIWVARWVGRALCSSTGSLTRSRSGWWPRGAARRSGSTTRRTRAGRCRRDRSADGEFARAADHASVRYCLKSMPATPAGG